MESGHSPPRRSARAAARRLAMLLLQLLIGLELVWLLAVHLLLLTPLGERLVNPRPERARVSWRGGWSLYPGHLHLRGFVVAGGGASPRWWVAADALAGRVELRRLIGRELAVSGLRARGVEVAAAQLPGATGAPSKWTGSRDRAPSPGPSPVRRRGWRIHLPAVEVAGLRRLVVGGLGLDGAGHGRLSLDLRPGRRVLLDVHRLALAGGRLAVGTTPLGEELVLGARLRLGPYEPRRHRGAAALAFLSGHLEASGRGLQAAAPRPGEASNATRPRSGPLRARVLVRGGRLEPGSELRLELPAALLQASDRLTAPRLELAVAPPPRARPGAPPELTLALAASTLETRLGRARAQLTGGALQIAARTRERRLAQLLGRHLQLGPLTATVSLERPRLRGARMGPLRLELAADTLRARLDLAALLRRELRLARLAGRGVELALAPAAAAPPPGPAPAPPGWTVELGEGTLDDLRSVRVGELEATGRGSLVVAASLDAAGSLAVPRFDVRLRDGQLLDRGRPAAGGIELELAAALPRTAAGAVAVDLVRRLEGRVRLRGELHQLRFLRHLVRARRWVELDGRGSVELVGAVQAGRLLAKSQLEIVAPALSVSGLGYQAHGRGSVKGTVAAGQAHLVVRFRELAVWPQPPPSGAAGAERAAAAAAALRRGAPHLRGRRLELQLATRDLDLVTAASHLRAELRLVEAQASDLAVFAGYLPASSGIVLRGGRGTVDVELTAESPSERARGRLRLRARRVTIGIPDLELAGGVTLDLALLAERLREGRFRIGGSRLEVSDLSWREAGEEAVARGSGWWGKARIPAGTLAWRQPVELRSEVELTLRDSGPLVSLVGRRRHLPRWVERAVTVADVTGRARLALQPEAVRIEAMEARGGRLELLGRMRLVPGGRRGELYLGYGPLGLGVALVDGSRDLRLLRPRAWYEALPALD